MNISQKITSLTLVALLISPNMLVCADTPISTEHIDSIELSKAPIKKSTALKCAHAVSGFMCSLTGVGLLVAGAAVGTFTNNGPNFTGHALTLGGALFSALSVAAPTQETSPEEEGVAFIDNFRKVLGMAGLVTAGSIWMHAYLKTPHVPTYDEKRFEELSQKYGVTVSNWEGVWKLYEKLDAAASRCLFNDCAPLYL